MGEVAALRKRDGRRRCAGHAARHLPLLSSGGPTSAKSIPLEYKHAQLFAKEFKVRWEWLLEGVGEPWLTKPKDDEPEGEAPNNLRAWREYRGLSTGELAKKAGTSAQIITDLETGAVELSQKWLRTLAPALDTTPGFLLDLDLNESDPAFFEVARSIPKERRAQALEILKTFRPYQRLK